MEIIDRKFLDTYTKTVHASTIAMYNGEPVFSWFGGIREGLKDSTVYVQHKDKQFHISNDGIAQWNPILFTIDDELILFYKKGIFCDRWQTYYCNISCIDDFQNNIDFMAHVDECSHFLPAGLNGPVKTKPIMVGDYIYCGASVETYSDWTSYIEVYKPQSDHGYKCGRLEFIDRSNPIYLEDKEEYMVISGHSFTGAANYQRRRTIGIIQPSLWFDGEAIHAVFRSSRGLEKLYYSSCNMSLFDMDWRNEWKDPIPLEFDNPNSGVDTVQGGGDLFLVHNPDPEKRLPLVLSRLDLDKKSIEDGKEAVTEEIVITEKTEPIEGMMLHTAELSYPYMIEDNGIIHLVYTYGRSKIEYVQIKT
jgi:predicted neuraminidase